MNWDCVGFTSTHCQLTSQVAGHEIHCLQKMDPGRECRGCSMMQHLVEGYSVEHYNNVRLNSIFSAKGARWLGFSSRSRPIRCGARGTQWCFGGHLFGHRISAIQLSSMKS